MQYVAFPLLFTTAFFSMDFLHPKLPWLVFFVVLIGTTIVNYFLVPHINLLHQWIDNRLRTVWTKLKALWHRLAD
jgi:hypothetical protein